MKQIIKSCMFAVLSLIHFQSCAHESSFNEDQVILEEEIIEHVNEDMATKDPVFVFDPERWGIIQGRVSDEVALQNRDILNNIMKQLVDMGIKIMEIGIMDAYFNVNERYTVNPENQAKEAILIPSNFELRMSDETYLRVQPNNAPAYNLMAVFKGNNIKISGGHLYGDRWDHDYSPVNDIYGHSRDTHDWGHVLQISGGNNILIDGVSMYDASGDGFGVRSSTIRNIDGTPGGAVIAENVTIINSIVKDSRRNGMSLLDGNGIYVTNCKILNTGQGVNPEGVKYSSAGVAPRYGISFEAYRERDENNQLLEYSVVENVILKGNTFADNKMGDIQLYTCSFVTIEENKFDSMIANKASHDITIKNNTFNARVNEEGVPFEYALLLRTNLDPFGNEFNYNYSIYGNIISGYKNGMVLSGENYNVYENNLINFKSGIGIGNLKNSNFWNNNLSSGVVNSYGYFTRGGTFEKVIIKNDVIDVTRRYIDLYNVIGVNENDLIFEACQFNSEKNSNISNSRNITIRNCTMNVGIDLNNSLVLFLGNNL